MKKVLCFKGSTCVPCKMMEPIIKKVAEQNPNIKFETIMAEEYDEFLKEEIKPAIIILDAGNAENLKGLKICKFLRENPDFANTKIIVTSIFHDKELILNCGADLYLPKPYELSNLIKWVNIFVDEVNFR